jgi:hypothetical protein
MKLFGLTLSSLLEKEGDKPSSSTSTVAVRRGTGTTLIAVVWIAALLLSTAVSATAQCTGPGAPTTTETKCVTAIAIPGNPLQSFDISWVNPDRAEYYLADRANSGVDIIDTRHKVFKKTIGGFVGIKLNTAGTAVDNNHSGPDGVVSRGKCLYVGDGDSTLKVIDLDQGKIVATRSTGGTTRLDEMALTGNGDFLLAANNAEDPPYATLFKVYRDADCDAIDLGTKITVDSSVIPSGFGLSIEQPAWDPKTERFYTSIPIIAENPPGCNYGQLAGPITCSGGLLVTNPHDRDAIEGLYDPIENTGVIKLNACGPNGATIGPHDNILLGCTPNNLPGSTTTLVINATTHNYVQVGGITGSDEVWFNTGDDRYYAGSSAAIKPAGSPLNRGSVLGVIDGTSVLIETIPQSSGSHSVAADSKGNLIFVPQVYTSSATAVPLGDQNFTGAVNSSPTVGQLICGTTNGCIAVYAHQTEDGGEGEDHDAGK